MIFRIACLVSALAVPLTAAAFEPAGHRHLASVATGVPSRGPMSVPFATPLLFAQLRSCKAVSSCRQAVEMWCDGYTRADGDNDGIPCERVCRSRREVDRIRAEIGC